MIYIFDLDGTLADLTHRLRFIQKESKDWDGFFKACASDICILPVVDLLKGLERAGNAIFIVTGRSEAVKDETKKWLRLNGIPYDELVMRKVDDHRHDNIIKKEWFESLEPQIKHCIAGVFENRASVVAMWRSLGLTCYQVAEGNF